MHNLLQDTSRELPEALKFERKKLNYCDSLVSSCNVVLPVSKDLRVQNQPCMRQKEKELFDNSVPIVRRIINACFFAALNVLDAVFSKVMSSVPKEHFWSKISGSELKKQNGSAYHWH